MDHFSPVAPAYLRVLVLPVGVIEASRFAPFVRRLQTEAALIPLSSVRQHDSDNDAFDLSPKACPHGSLLYRFSSAAPSDQHQQISPYELFRDPLIVLGVVDAADSANVSEKELADAAAYLRERHPRVVLRQVIVLHNKVDELPPSSAIRVVNADEPNAPSLRAAICELSARFLPQLSTYAKAVQALPTIQTPGQAAKGLQRSVSLRDSEKRPTSGHATSSQVSSLDGERSSGSFSGARPPPLPATSFDEMPGASEANRSIDRPQSESSAVGSKSKTKAKTGARSSSQDRVASQGFGQSSTQEKTRAKGKARVGIVVGSIYMMSGHYSEGLRLLSESTAVAQALTDHLWHAKGLENMLVCMILLAWSGSDFRLPKLCDIALDKPGGSKFSRASSTTTSAPRDSAESAKDKSQAQQLSAAIPGLIKKILGLLRYAEGTLELPFLVFAEASVRFAKLLAALNAAHGELTSRELQAIAVTSGPAESDAAEQNAQSHKLMTDVSKAHSKHAIAEMLSQALPSGGQSLAVGDHIQLLAGVASAYSALGFRRKKALAIDDLVTHLTGAIMQARKLGAAEMGIHPAASLSPDTGADTLLAIAAESTGVVNLMHDASTIYGAPLASSSWTETPVFGHTKAFGNPDLKLHVLKAFAGLCEAEPDPNGVLLMTASLLRAAGPNAAIDAAPIAVANAFTREEQMHFAHVIRQTIAVSKHLGLADVRVVYWDPFLVRGVEVMQPTGAGTLLDRAKLEELETSSPENPLLYDPNASRPGTAIRQAPMLVEGETAECVVTLQNPFDIPIDVEALNLVTDGLEIESQHEPVTLGPLRFQRVSLAICPAHVGLTKIIGCRVKMQGCHPQVFPIVSKAWCDQSPLTLKNMGLDARPAYDHESAKFDLKGLGLEPAAVPVAVIERMPILVLESTLESHSGIMLLDGEVRTLVVQLRNPSTVSASVFDVTDSAKVLKLEGELSTTIVRPGECITFQFAISGRAGTAATTANFHYATCGPSHSKYARMVSVPVEMTVSASLQVQRLEIRRSAEHDFLEQIEIAFDVRNAWTKALSYELYVGGGEEPDQQGSLVPGEARRVHLLIPRPPGVTALLADANAVRDLLLHCFQVRWKADSRSGTADLQSLLLSPGSLDVLCGSHIAWDVSAVPGTEVDAKVKVGSFVVVRVKLSKSSESGLFVQLSKSAVSDSDSALHYSPRFTVAGRSKRPLPPTGTASGCEVDFVVCPLLSGKLDLEFVLGKETYGTSGGSNWSETWDEKRLSLEVL